MGMFTTTLSEFQVPLEAHLTPTISTVVQRLCGPVTADALFPWMNSERSFPNLVKEMYSDFLSYPDYLDDVFDVVVPVGSRVTCSPPPTDTDLDLLCYPKKWNSEWYEVLDSTGWRLGGEIYGTRHEFQSWRKEHYNLIVTISEPFFDSFMEATEVCKKLNLLDKKDRIAKFDEIFAKNAPPPKKTIKKTLIDDVQSANVSQQAIEQLMVTVSSFNWAGAGQQATIVTEGPQW